MDGNMMSVSLLCLALFLQTGFIKAQNDGVSIVYDAPIPGSYTVDEDVADGALMVCIRVQGTVNQGFSVTISTVEIGSATAGVDYEDTSVTHIYSLPINTLTRCSSITIHNDEIVEAAEFLSLSITSTDASVTLPPSDGFVTIENDDFVTIGFNQTTYTAVEGNPAKVCAIVTSGSTAIPVSFTVLSTDGTASALDGDYIQTPLSGSISVAEADEPKCVFVTLGTDTLVEESETVQLALSSPQSSLGDTATLFIQDDDGATLEVASNGLLSVVEGDTVSTPAQLCVELTSVGEGLRRDVVLSLSTEASTADSSDFVPFSNQLLTIHMSTALEFPVCYQLDILPDLVCEQSELFTVSISTVNSLDTINVDEAFITIQDNGDTVEDCGPLSISFGTVDYPSTTRGAVATYTCQNGYIREGTEMRVCEATGTVCVGEWSGTAPTCRIADCGSLTSPDDGVVSTPFTTYLSTATYSCNTGFTLNGASTRICQANEEWSGEMPVCDPIVCPVISAPGNGAVTLTNGFFAGSRATFTCDQGYQLNGPPFLFCRNSGVWNGPEPTCDPVDCFGLPNPDNGQVVLTGTTFMHTAMYSCSTGFALVGDSSRECLSTALWSGEPPVCVVDCGLLAIPSNGGVSYNPIDSTLLDTVATFSCETGYVLTDSQTRTCLSSGAWSDNQPSCPPVDCMALDDPTNGQAVYTTTTLGSVTSFTCDLGYMLSSTEDRVCQASALWSGTSPECIRIDCGILTPPQSGSVSLDPGTDFGSVAIYSCNVGFELNGVNSRTCEENEMWSGDPPTCTLVDCGPPSTPEFGSRAVGVTTYLSIAVYDCEDGYILSVEDNVRTCMADGSWSGPDPTCDPVDCGSLDLPTNGQVTYAPPDSTVFMSTATYSCDSGYDLVGQITSRMCEDDGEWSGQSLPDPQCQPVDCGNLSPPANGGVTLSATTFQSEANYTCNPGYLLVGVASRTCLANTSWSDEEPICEPVACLTLDNPTNGMVDLSEGTLLGSVARYNCTVGYRIDGMDDVEERTCGPDGTWSGDAPMCEIVTCPDDRVAPENGIISLQTGLIFGSVVSYQCDPTFALSGESSQTCGADGMWTNEPPMCIMLSCTIRDDPENGFSQELQPGNPNLIVYSCDDGYHFTEDQEVLAVSLCEPTTGEWSGDVPFCTIDDCGPPPEVPGATVSFTMTVYLSEASYSCQSGFMVQPPTSTVRVCEAGEEWSGEEATCEPVDCGSLTNPANGDVSFEETTRGSMATYSCNDNFTQVGDSMRTCMDSGVWSGSEPVCQDIDECSLETDECKQECINTVGGYECACEEGYLLTGFSDCPDIDECSTNKGGCSQVCVNTEGSRDCDCIDGYTLDADGVNCNEIDECSLDMDDCHSNASCTNTEGGFNCSCLPGFEGNGTFCQDVDECQLDSDDCSEFANCTNTEGSFMCACISGYSGNGQNCRNIDECSEGNVSCADNATCVDTQGSYTCVCEEGYTGDGVNNCTDVDECASEMDDCHDFASCENTAGSFVCFCDLGFSGDGVNCQNVNECMEGTHGCHANARCMDTIGSFDCSCKPGFSGDGFNCTERCTRLFQIVLSGVINCPLWRVDDTNNKLNETATKLTEEIQDACTSCSLSASQISSGEFRCEPVTPDDVIYRAELTGNTDSDCVDLVDDIEAWVEVESRAAITVGGLSLGIASNCEVGIEDLNSPLECETQTSPSTIPVVSTVAVNIPVIAGAAAGGVLLLIVVMVVIIVVLSLIMSSRRKRKSVEIPTHFVDDPVPTNEYMVFTTPHHPSVAESPSVTSSHRPLIPQESLTDFGQSRDLRQSTFNPEGDVIPMLGRSYSTLSRNRIKQLAVDQGETQQPTEDGVYDRVYDDGTLTTTATTQQSTDIEEFYDTGPVSMEIDADVLYDSVAKEELEPESEPIYEPEIEPDGFNDSFESGSDESDTDAPKYENKIDLGLYDSI